MWLLSMRPGFNPNIFQLFMKPTLFSGHQLDSQQLNDDRLLMMWALVRLGRGPEKPTESDIVFAKLHTDSILGFMTSSWWFWMSLLLTWITILSNLCSSWARSFSLASMSPAVAPDLYVSVVAGISGSTSLRTESPITRVFFRASRWKMVFKSWYNFFFFPLSVFSSFSNVSSSASRWRRGPQ